MRTTFWSGRSALLVCGLPNRAFPVKLKSFHLSNTRHILTDMSLVKRNDLKFVVKSLTVHLAGRVIVHITAEPLTTKLVVFTVLRHMSTRRILLRLHFDLVIIV